MNALGQGSAKVRGINRGPRYGEVMNLWFAVGVRVLVGLAICFSRFWGLKWGRLLHAAG